MAIEEVGYQMKRLILILLILLTGCSCQSKCVNVNYWHVEQGFNRGMYPMVGRLLTSDIGFPPITGMVFDIKWIELKDRCPSPFRMKTGWYAVYFDDGNILYGIGGPDGIIELNAQVLPDSVLVDKPCFGGRCKK